MATKIKIIAICGWALPEDWFCHLVETYFPGAEVRACYPRNPENEEEAAFFLADTADLIIGYSLGSLWILHHKNKISQNTKIALMAPILAFPAEKNLGGKTPYGKLKYQRKMLASVDDYASAVKGFFDLSGIRLQDKELKQPYSRDILIQGLNFLEKVSVSPKVAEGCIAVSGQRDPLLDGKQLKQLIPHLTLLEECDHSPHKLLSHLSQHPGITNNPIIPASQIPQPQRYI